jgi:hypothetical protein
MEAPHRFECREERHGLWTVWDIAARSPANLGGVELRNRRRVCANAACDILRRIYASGLDARSVRQGRPDTHLQA